MKKEKPNYNLMDNLKVGDDVMINQGFHKYTYSRFLTYGGISHRLTKPFSYGKKLCGGYVVGIAGEKVLVGIGYNNFEENKHHYYPSYYREDLDKWEVCKKGTWIDREDCYLLGGLGHHKRRRDEMVIRKKELDSEKRKVIKEMRKLNSEIRQMEMN